MRRRRCVKAGLSSTSRPNVPIRATSSARIRLNSCSVGPTQQRQIALHAARDVQHDDQANRSRRIVEEGDRLRAPLVPQFEIFLFQRGDEAIVAVGHRDEDADQITGTAEDYLSGNRHAAGQSEDQDGTQHTAREDANHEHSPSSLAGIVIQS